MPIHITEEGKIVYYAYPNGDRVPDFSYCGYQRSEHPIPYIEAKVYVHPPQGDATAVIQRAIDYVSSLPLQDNQFRGAIQLLPGIYHIEGQLLIRKSGIVLRGSGCNASGGTVLQAKGFTKNELIRILGYDNAETSDSLKVSDKYVPVNATFIPLASADKHLKVGDKIRVIRPCTPEWLAELGTDRLGNQQEYNFSKWQPGQYTMAWERNVTQVSKEGIEIDVPITMSLDPEYGGGYVTPLKWTGRIYNIGIEEAKLRVKTPEGISIGALRQEAAPETVLFEILHPLGFNAAQVRDICRTLDGQPGKVFATPGWRVIKDRGSLLIEPVQEAVKPLLEMKEHPYAPDFMIPRDKATACFDADKLQHPLSLRLCRQGDSFVPFGMKGRKKVSDYLTDRKFSLLRKERQWVLCCGDDIIWLVGERVDNRFRIDEKTRKVLVVSTIDQ